MRRTPIQRDIIEALLLVEEEPLTLRQVALAASSLTGARPDTGYVKIVQWRMRRAGRKLPDRPRSPYVGSHIKKPEDRPLNAGLVSYATTSRPKVARIRELLAVSDPALSYRAIADAVEREGHGKVEGPYVRLIATAMRAAGVRLPSIRPRSHWD